MSWMLAIVLCLRGRSPWVPCCGTPWPQQSKVMKREKAQPGWRLDSKQDPPYPMPFPAHTSPSSDGPGAGGSPLVPPTPGSSALPATSWLDLGPWGCFGSKASCEDREGASLRERSEAAWKSAWEIPPSPLSPCGPHTSTLFTRGRGKRDGWSMDTHSDPTHALHHPINKRV